MKRKCILISASVFGVFLMVNTPLLAQSTGVSKESSREAERVEREALRAAREANEARVIVAPDIQIGDWSQGDYGFAYTTLGTSTAMNSKLTLSKRYSGQSTSKTGTFNIEEGVTRIRLQISGTVEVGKIGLELYLPGKKVLKQLTIDDSADISWSQSINIKEGETKYYGEWTYVIKAESVEGRYQMSINTY